MLTPHLPNSNHITLSQTSLSSSFMAHPTLSPRSSSSNSGTTSNTTTDKSVAAVTAPIMTSDPSNATNSASSCGGEQIRRKKQKMMTTLKGVVFKMDDTLVKSNFDISNLYRKVFGRDPSQGKVYDVLKEIDTIECVEKKAKAYKIIDDIREESRSKMTLMPGCVELLTWFSLQKIPTALLTRNSRTTTDVFCERLQSLEEDAHHRGQISTPDLSFKRIITKDDPFRNNQQQQQQDGNGSSSSDGILPSAAPAADPSVMKLLADECFECTCGPEILMVVGNNPPINDHYVNLGKKAGTSTAILTTPSINNTNEEETKTDEDSANNNNNNNDDDHVLNVYHLTQLPKQLWNNYYIDGPLGNSPSNEYGKFQQSNAPIPQSELCSAVANGDVSKVKTMLERLSLDETTKPDENGNTALIWAAEVGNDELARLLLDDVFTKSIATHDTQERLTQFQNHRGYLGATALNRAARRNHTNVLELLIRQGDRYDMDIPNHKMQYPLHFAAFKQKIDALEYLLMCGANPWVLDRKGRTPIEDTTCEMCKNLLRDAMS